MLNRFTALVVAAVAAAGIFARARAAEPKAQEVRAGEVSLQESKDVFSEDKVVKISFGTAVKVDTGWYINPDFFGRKIVIANAQVENTGVAEISTSYFVAFFDKDKKLVGCTGQSMDLGPGKKMSYGSCLIEVPPDQIARITSYQIAFYTGEPAKKK